MGGVLEWGASALQWGGVSLRWGSGETPAGDSNVFLLAELQERVNDGDLDDRVVER